MAFNWKDCTLEEATSHILTSSYAAVSRARKYYADRGVEHVVTKIDSARKVARKIRMQRKLEDM